MRIETSSRGIKRKQRPKYVGRANISRITPGYGIRALTRVTDPCESKTQAEVAALMCACLELMRISLSPDGYQRVSAAYLAAPATNPNDDVKSTCDMIAEAIPGEMIVGTAMIQEVHPDGTVIEMPLTIGDSVFGTHWNGV